MALVACSECKAEVSTQAISCPKCGCPQAAVAAVVVKEEPKSDTMAMTFTSVAMGILGAFMWFGGGGNLALAMVGMLLMPSAGILYIYTLLK